MGSTDHHTTIAEPIFGNSLGEIHHLLRETPTRTQRPRAIYIFEADETVETPENPDLSELNVHHSAQPCLTSQYGILDPELTGRAPELVEFAHTRPVSFESTGSTFVASVSERRQQTLASLSTVNSSVPRYSSNSLSVNAGNNTIADSIRGNGNQRQLGRKGRFVKKLRTAWVSFMGVMGIKGERPPCGVCGNIPERHRAG